MWKYTSCTDIYDVKQDPYYSSEIRKTRVYVKSIKSNILFLLRVCVCIYVIKSPSWSLDVIHGYCFFKTRAIWKRQVWVITKYRGYLTWSRGQLTFPLNPVHALQGGYTIWKQRPIVLVWTSKMEAFVSAEVIHFLYLKFICHYLEIRYILLSRYPLTNENKGATSLPSESWRDVGHLQWSGNTCALLRDSLSSE